MTEPGVTTYLITRDLVPTLRRKIGLDLDQSIATTISELERTFMEEFWQHVPPNIERAEALAEEVTGGLESKARQSRLPIVSLDRVYMPNADAYLEVTRITDPQTGKVKVAERPGSEPIQKQIERLNGYKRITLVDVGAFEGETLSVVCEALSQNKVEIENIVLGFTDARAPRRINHSIDVTSLRSFNFYEWIELRDFFGIDGRLIDDGSGLRKFMPYWENPRQWASIAQDRETAVIDLCKQYNRRLINLLETNGLDTRKIGEHISYQGK